MSFGQVAGLVGSGVSPLLQPQFLMSGQRRSTPPDGKCCETGRPIATDPTTGQTICSCQYPAGLLSTAYPRFPGVPNSIYASAYAAAAAAQGCLPAAFGVDPTAFYSSMGGGLDMKENAEAWSRLQATAACYSYDPSALASYPYASGYGVDLAGARRKNATRETTSTLKAWLYEHRKNPYPTKGEKIMLAIITKMTLTQVSTWFANARRRLKKENKMTWSPRNRCGEDDEDDSDDDETGQDKQFDTTFGSEDSLRVTDDAEQGQSEQCREIPTLPSSAAENRINPPSSPKNGNEKSTTGTEESTTIRAEIVKPKIWSLAYTATCLNPTSSPVSKERKARNECTNTTDCFSTSPGGAVRPWVSNPSPKNSVNVHPYSNGTKNQKLVDSPSHSANTPPVTPPSDNNSYLLSKKELI